MQIVRTATVFCFVRLFLYPQVVTDLGSSRLFLAVGFVSKSKEMSAVTFFSWLHMEQFRLWFPATWQSHLSGCSCENHRSVDKPLKGRWCWGEGPLREDHKAGSEEVVADERWMCTQRLVFILKHAIAFHMVLETFQGLHFLMLKFLLVFTSWSSFLLNYE